MCKIDLSVTNINLDEARPLVNKNLSLYREQVVSLISKQKIEGIRFGRCFIQDEEVYKMLHDILGDEILDVRVQTLYEILTEQETPNKLKEKWLDFLLENHVNFKNMCKNSYSLKNKNDKAEYFQKLVTKKIPETEANKKWVYFIELVILYSGDEKTKDVINKQIHDSGDLFLKQAGEKCLEYLKAD